MNRSDFKKLAEIRLEDAKALLASRNYSGAYYLAGYAIECGLEACIAKQTKRHDFPDKKIVQDSYTHNLPALLDDAGRKSVLDAEMKSNALFSTKWTTVIRWTEESRYKQFKRADAEALYSAIADPADGVLQWLKQNW